MRALIIDPKKNTVEVNITSEAWKALGIDLQDVKRNANMKELDAAVREFLASCEK